jgi:pseudouridine kinase
MNLLDPNSGIVEGLCPDNPVLVIGAAVVDIVGRLQNGLQPESSSPAQIRTSFGGVARNVAENLARLGQPVRLISVVGQDSIGAQLIHETGSAGVDVDAVMQVPEHPTNSYLAVIDEKGKLHFALDDMRAAKELKPDYLHQHAALFKEASMVFLDANLPKETIRTAISLANKARVPIVADPTAPSLAHRFTRHLSKIYMLTPNNAEAGVYCEIPFDPSNQRQALKVAKNLVSQGVKIAIISLAEHGVCYAASQTRGYIPALRTRILDPTGAGDALTATVMFGMLNKIPLDEAVRLAVSAASLTLNYRGAVVPDLSLEKLYDRLVI